MAVILPKTEKGEQWIKENMDVSLEKAIVINIDAIEDMVADLTHQGLDVETS